MTWQRLRYGTLVIAGVAVTGTSIYVSNRRTTEAVDLIELTEGLEERYRMAYADQPPPSRVSTQAVPVWVDTAYSYPVPDGTNPPGTRAFLAYGGLTNLVTTNAQAVAGSYAWTETYSVITGRLIWAGWSNLTATVFDDATVTGTYTLARYTDASTSLYSRGMVGYYTNGGAVLPAQTNWVLRDIQNRDNLTVPGESAPGARGWIISKSVVAASNDPPWYWTYLADPIGVAIAPVYYTTAGWHDSFRGTTNWWRINPLGADSITGLVASVGNPDTNALHSAPAVYSERRINALARYVPSQGYWTTFDAALTNVVGNFVAGFDATAGAPLYHSVTGLFATLQIGDRTNRFTRSITNGVPIYGAVGRNILRTNMVERYRVLQALTSTVVSATWSTVVSNGVTNVLYTSHELETNDLPFATPGDYWPDPVLDAYITNAAGASIPSWWISVDQDSADTTQAFFTDPFPSRTFDGVLKGDITVTTNTSAPRFEYTWRYDYLREEGLDTEKNCGLGGDWQIVSWYLKYYGTIDEDAQTHAAGRLQYSIQSDLTGVSHSASVYVRALDRTNRNSDAYASTGTWWLAAATNGTVSTCPWTNTTTFLGVPNTSVSSNVAGGWASAYWDNEISDCAVVGMGQAHWNRGAEDWYHDGAQKYFGRILTNQVMILNWTPHRCTN